MDAFARCFLLVFAQLFVGGFLALSVPPFHGIERGFYKSTAAVYLGAGALALVGRFTLLLRPPGETALGAAAQSVELLLWTAAVMAGAVYLRSLWGDDFRLRARAFAATCLTGLIALAVQAQSFRLSRVLSLETILYPVNFVVSALVLGAVTTGMLLGHWYLIDRNLSIEPFKQIFRFFAAMLVIQAGLVVLDGGLFGFAGTRESAINFAQLLRDHGSLLTVRLLLSPISAAALAWMIWKTLQIPQTMAATGLFYIAILSVLVGELMSRLILFRTSLPM
jgi:hypothetical protein